VAVHAPDAGNCAQQASRLLGNCLFMLQSELLPPLKQ
jgi:hypothetical protein